LAKGSQVEIRQNLKIDPTLQLWGDCQRIEQVIIGLVQFCMVFTQRGAITITSDFSEKEQRLKFEVRDNGAGMDDLELK
jgi:light-regulated signal transduction histidine kinase (bacteriophytochrome)